MSRSWIAGQSLGLVGPRGLASVGDRAAAEPLDRYLTARNEAAFAARLGPMVGRACRGSLANPDDAADAFQATSLVLARPARSIRRRASSDPS